MESILSLPKNCMVFLRIIPVKKVDEVHRIVYNTAVSYTHLGKEVVEKTFNTDTELLDELVCHLKCPGDFETAALITTTEEEAFDLSRLLKLRGINVSYVDRNSSAFKKGLTVTTFYLAKGLEFDQVFALRGAKENPLKNQAEYICATRALHELYVYEIADSLSK